MSDESDKEDYSDRTISDEDESDEDTFMKFVSEDIHQCALLTDWAPFYPEPVYIPTGLEMEPLYPNSKEDTVVYLAEDAYKEPCFVYSRVGGNRTPLKQPVDGCDNTLMFEARFESGNLQKVVKVAEYEYHLTVRPDLFTNKHTQWYYFQVTNTQAEMDYRFTIVNFTKPASLYNRGMRPLFYSEKEAKARNIGWQRIGDQIKYYRNNLGQDGRHFFSLTWTFQFPHNKDTCYFAHCYPYTYTNLQEYLSSINNDPVRSKFCKIRVLCHTLARNMVYVLTITTPLKNTDSRKRKAVILTARVHPGETNSSWIMKGFLDYILGHSSDAQLLRDTFVFKVVPMLNPDGVIVGNYRCSLTGQDLNRNYTSLLKESFPSVWYTRNMVHRLMEKQEVILYCDLHGHSRKENIFMYGCGGSDRSKALYLQQRIFPLMLSKNCPDKFSFSSCKFNVQKSKGGTGRVVMWKMGIRNSFTMEATFCGSTLGNKRGTHFNTKDLESMGYHFCDSLLDYCDPDRSKYYQCLKELEEMEKHVNMKKVFADSDSCLREITLDIESSSRGSDSSESNDSQTYLLKVTSQIKTKKKYLKTKKERNSTIASHQNAKAEVHDREHLQQTHEESNSDAKDLHDNLKIKAKECPSFQRKKTSINWTDDEKRIYRNKRIVQSQELLQYFLPMVESPRSIERTNFQISHQLKQASCINIKRYSTSWTPRNPPFITPKSLMTNTSDWLQCVPRRPPGNFSPFKGYKRKNFSQTQATKTEDIESLSSKWETASPSFEMDANILKDKSLPAEEYNLQRPMQVVPHLTKNKGEHANKKDGHLAFHRRFQRDN
ncbi:cytosolic carboxypeptidase 3 isoform X4 [Fukomys damarensis]|uniref:cytosolic carboxypeptidase 3 isoform X4 n=1 Tax=Fukomys damarensis TaxID=885580 RepID=UPI0008FF4F0C|nr:cytosolic carboxypeptidase 3 isoform X4 [Fukomys damarensis]